MIKLSELRGRIRDEDEGTWFITLADLLTLLMAFFVLMLSVSNLDQERYKKVAQSMEDALKTEKAKREAAQAQQKPMGFSLRQETTSPTGQLYPVIQPSLPPEVYRTPPGPATQPPPEAGPQPKPKSIDELGSELGKLFNKDNSGAQVEKRAAGYAVTLKGAVLFDRGSADLTPTSTPYLDSIAQTLRNTPYKITVEGHTDDVPIQSFLYPSNWELSAARASRVARYLIDRAVPMNHIHVAGYADTEPVAPNENPQGQPLPENQARNRRVVVLITP
jgi:chemotaxis protein MotB